MAAFTKGSKLWFAKEGGKSGFDTTFSDLRFPNRKRRAPSFCKSDHHHHHSHTPARHLDTQTQEARGPKMEDRDEGGSTTTAPPHQQEKDQLENEQSETTHDAADPTQAIGNAPHFLGERQPLPDELQLLEDFQRLLDESHVVLPRRYLEARRFYLLFCQLSICLSVPAVVLFSFVTHPA